MKTLKIWLLQSRILFHFLTARAHAMSSIKRMLCMVGYLINWSLRSLNSNSACRWAAILTIASLVAEHTWECWCMHSVFSSLLVDADMYLLCSQRIYRLILCPSTWFLLLAGKFTELEFICIAGRTNAHAFCSFSLPCVSLCSCCVNQIHTHV